MSRSGKRARRPQQLLLPMEPKEPVVKNLNQDLVLAVADLLLKAARSEAKEAARDDRQVDG